MRYSRQIMLPEIGEIGQQKLKKARVLVVGAGGLGCSVLQNLVAIGVGNIGVVDGDIVETTNLHRQLLYRETDCGEEKVKIAAKALKALNSDVNIAVFSDFLGKNNALEIVTNYQIIVDCTDTIDVRYLINDLALAKNIPVVYASIYKFEGQLSVFNYKNGPSYRCLFPEIESIKKVTSCVESGVVGVLPNTLGTLQATEVLKIILEIGTVLSGKLLIYDCLNFQTNIIDFQKQNQQIEIGFQKGLAIIRDMSSIENLTSIRFFQKLNDNRELIVDIREFFEEPKIEATNVINIPLENLENYFSKLAKNSPITLFCQYGQQSRMVLNYFKKLGFTQLSHLEKGILSLEKKYYKS